MFQHMKLCNTAGREKIYGQTLGSRRTYVSCCSLKLHGVTDQSTVII